MLRSACFGFVSAARAPWFSVWYSVYRIRSDFRFQSCRLGLFVNRKRVESFTHSRSPRKQEKIEIPSAQSQAPPIWGWSIEVKRTVELRVVSHIIPLPLPPPPPPHPAPTPRDQTSPLRRR
jgi:hypothetical protein